MHKYSPATLGKNLNKIKTESFNITEAKYAPNTTFSRHAHRSLSLTCVLKGSFYETFSSQNYECIPRTFLFKPPGEFHTNRYLSKETHCLIIEISEQKADRLETLSEIFKQIKHLEAKESFAIVRRIYGEFSVFDNLSEIAVEGLMLELLTNLARRGNKILNSDKPSWLLKAKEYIHDRHKENIGLSKIADTIGVHPSQLARVFRQKYNLTVGDYIRRLRLEFAAEQIIKTQKTFAEIASEAGFYDQSYFTKAFKNLYGVTPTIYRKTCLD